MPVEESIPIGFLAAAVSLAEALEEQSALMFAGFLPNILMSYLILRAHKVKSWSFIVLLVYAVISLWGVLIWLSYPTPSFMFWTVDLAQSFEALKYGYWVWATSIFTFMFSTILERTFFQKHLKKKEA